MQRIKEKIVLRVLTSNEQKIENTSTFFDLSENIMLYPQYKQLLRQKGQKEQVTPDTQAYILLKKYNYNNYLEGERLIPKKLKAKHKVQWKHGNFVAYTMNNFPETTSILMESKVGSILEKIDLEVRSIQEISLSYLKSKREGTILGKLFEKYFGDNVVIPYKLEDRKALYPLAFEELKDYMNDYLLK